MAHPSEDPPQGSPFRPEAVAHHVGAQDGGGDVLRISSRWVDLSYWLLLLVCLAGLLYAALGRVYQYASGPALVRVEGRTDLTARQAGMVVAVDVGPGQRVAAGQVLVRFAVSEEQAELSRIDRELELLLVRTLRDPNDQGARQALAALRAQREQAATRLQDRSVRAPVAGIVSDVRIRPGKHLQPGDAILALVGEDARYYVEAMLPGHYRPLLQPGMPLRLELSGYRYEYKDLIVAQVNDEVVGPEEVRRYLPPELADSVTLPGPVVLVRAQVPSPTFLIDGRARRYAEGMQGTAEVRVRSESLLLTLVPGLKVLHGN